MLRKRPSGPGLVGLVDPYGRPVRAERPTVRLEDVVGDIPAKDATAAHYRVRAFYRKLFRGRADEGSVLNDLATTDDREWLESILAGLQRGEPGPSSRTRKRWRRAAEFRLAQLPPAPPAGPPIPEPERTPMAAEMAR